MFTTNYVYCHERDLSKKMYVVRIVPQQYSCDLKMRNLIEEKRKCKNGKRIDELEDEIVRMKNNIGSSRADEPSMITVLRKFKSDDIYMKVVVLHGQGNAFILLDTKLKVLVDDFFDEHLNGFVFNELTQNYVYKVSTLKNEEGKMIKRFDVNTFVSMERKVDVRKNIDKDNLGLGLLTVRDEKDVRKSGDKSGSSSSSIENLGSRYEDSKSSGEWNRVGKGGKVVVKVKKGDIGFGHVRGELKNKKESLKNERENLENEGDEEDTVERRREVASEDEYGSIGCEGIVEEVVEEELKLEVSKKGESKEKGKEKEKERGKEGEKEEIKKTSVISENKIESVSKGGREFVEEKKNMKGEKRIEKIEGNGKMRTENLRLSRRKLTNEEIEKEEEMIILTGILQNTFKGVYKMCPLENVEVDGDVQLVDVDLDVDNYKLSAKRAGEKIDFIMDFNWTGWKCLGSGVLIKSSSVFVNNVNKTVLLLTGDSL